MALGGGSFMSQNKVLPGAYINFVSAARASSALSERGAATMPVTLEWGVLGCVMEVTPLQFRKDSKKLFGYDYTSPELKGLRDIFLNVRVAYLYRLGEGGAAASNSYATAKYVGTRGNDLTVAVAETPDDATKMEVSLYLGGEMVDRQTVSDAGELADNGYVVWQKGADLDATAGAPLSGGSSPTVTNAGYQAYLDAIESYSFNAIGCPSGDANVRRLFAAFTKRLRDDNGVKFQCAVYNPDAGASSGHEGVVDVLNKPSDIGAGAWELVYWVTGTLAGTAVNASALNKIYDGEYAPDVAFTQAELESAIKCGKFAFHRVGADIRVLADINSLVAVTDTKGEDFKQNQTIRVIDQVANDIAALFNAKYLGAVPNDADGRVSLWSDIVRQHEQLQAVRAIEGFDSGDVEIIQGETKRSVVVSDKITPVNAMAQLYMAVTVN